VGNAVPTRLGRVAGKVIMELLTTIEQDGMAKKNRCNHTITHIRPHVRTRTFWKNGESFSGDVSYYLDDDISEEQQAEQLELDFG